MIAHDPPHVAGAPREPAAAPGMAGTPPNRGSGPARGAALLVLLMALALEALPVTTWLVLFAAVNHAVGDVPLPLWWIVLVLLAAWGVAVLLRQQPSAGSGARLMGFGVRALMVCGWMVSALLSLLISPAAYGGLAPAAGLSRLGQDVVTGSGQLGGDLGVLLLLTYLWWRGLLLGNQPLTRDRLYGRFLWGLGAIILAIAGAGALHGLAQQSVAAALSLLLPAEVFAGLVGLALAHLADIERERRERQVLGSRLSDATPDAQATITRAWLATALGMSGAVVAIALVLALVVSYATVGSLAALFRPVFQALGTVILWLIEGLAFVLFLLLDGPLTWIQQHIATSSQQQQTLTPPKPIQTPSPTQHAGALSQNWLLAGRWTLLVLVVVILALLLLAALRRYRTWLRPQAFEEEREAMDAADVLGAQLRALLGRLRRRPATHLEEERLDAASVRALYRRVLIEAGQAGLARRPEETPDEYARRLSAALAMDGGDRQSPDGEQQARAAVTTITAAYNPARYGASTAAARAPAPVATAQERLLRWLAGRQPRRNTRHGRHLGR